MAEEKAGLLAQPDVFISAVGTRIYNYDSDGEWEEDAAWTVPLTLTQTQDASQQQLEGFCLTQLRSG